MSKVLNHSEIDTVKRMRPTVRKDIPIEIGSGEETWSGSGTSINIVVTGVEVGDIVTATIKSAPTEAAYIASAVAGANQVTVTLSAANTSDDAVIAYSVKR